MILQYESPESLVDEVESVDVRSRSSGTEGGAPSFKLSLFPSSWGSAQSPSSRRRGFFELNQALVRTSEHESLFLGSTSSRPRMRPRDGEKKINVRTSTNSTHKFSPLTSFGKVFHGPNNFPSRWALNSAHLSEGSSQGVAVRANESRLACN